MRSPPTPRLPPAVHDDEEAHDEEAFDEKDVEEEDDEEVDFVIFKHLFVRAPISQGSGLSFSPIDLRPTVGRAKLPGTARDQEGVRAPLKLDLYGSTARRGAPKQPARTYEASRHAPLSTTDNDAAGCIAADKR